MANIEDFEQIHTTSPEGWHRIGVRDATGVTHWYVETAEVDAEGRAVFEYEGEGVPGYSRPCAP